MTPDAASYPDAPNVPPDAAVLPDASPDAPAVPRIHIVADAPPLLVAVKDGAGDWQTPVAANGGFDAEVHGPYSVMYVCLDGGDGVLVNQTFQTPDDDRVVQFFCRPTPVPPHTVTGHMVQAGSVTLAGELARSRTPEWDFALAANDGTFDLFASSDDRIRVRRGVVVSGDTAVAPIDLAQDGEPLVGVAFTIPNAGPGEVQQAAVGLLNPTSPDFPSRIYLGDAAAARVAPDAALIATDVQSVSLRAIKTVGNKQTTRALRRPFRVGGDASYVVPDAIQGLVWSTPDGLLGVRWGAAPELALNSFSASPLETFGGQSLVASQHYLQAVHVKALAIDPAVPGFQASWRMNFVRPYFRSAFMQEGAELATLTTTSIDETVDRTGVTQPHQTWRKREL